MVISKLVCKAAGSSPAPNGQMVQWVVLILSYWERFFKLIQEAAWLKVHMETKVSVFKSFVIKKEKMQLSLSLLVASHLSCDTAVSKDR